MAFWQARDFLFCGVCGTLLKFDSVRSASCPLCGFKRKAKDIEGKETRYTVTAEVRPIALPSSSRETLGSSVSVATDFVSPQDIRRELKLDPYVILETTLKEEDVIVERATVNKECEKCKNPELQYYTKQLRSADEGQTVFYKCAKCRHEFNENQ
uniref:DNA-directed RNA polymerase subunit n=1 Tax=Oryza glaberrima TaxID=4538 RepID=I1PEY5_ORYGL